MVWAPDLTQINYRDSPLTLYPNVEDTARIGNSEIYEIATSLYKFHALPFSLVPVGCLNSQKSLF